MKLYLITTCAIFGLITLAHIARIIAEGAQLGKDPFFILLTIVAAGMCLWAGLLLKNSRRL